MNWKQKFRGKFFDELESYIDSGYPRKVESFIEHEVLEPLFENVESMKKKDTTAKDLRSGIFQRGEFDFRDGYNRAINDILALQDDYLEEKV